ncbi:hypothetical protein [Ammonifex thiophilus]|uniref:Uncharacterized protein n=1 Tax=Ammonifex thiophilus TaxID=444093 RepID=A0A3D8P354_9THEO|nr:hypothetical protein [Ammonifex thiophilus]RDV80743.1 hypothetical protein DXX99_10445 [Ammonifex thiophilus]
MEAREHVLRTLLKVFDAHSRFVLSCLEEGQGCRPDSFDVNGTRICSHIDTLRVLGKEIIVLAQDQDKAE